MGVCDPLPQGVVDFAAGVGDIASPGFTEKSRADWNIGGVNTYSDE